MVFFLSLRESPTSFMLTLRSTLPSLVTASTVSRRAWVTPPVAAAVGESNGQCAGRHLVTERLGAGGDEAGWTRFPDAPGDESPSLGVLLNDVVLHLVIGSEGANGRCSRSLLGDGIGFCHHHGLMP